MNSHRSHRARRNDFNVSEKLDETHLTYLDQGKTFEVRKFELDELAEALLQERLDTQIQVSCPTANHNAQCLITLFLSEKPSNCLQRQAVQSNDAKLIKTSRQTKSLWW